MDLRFYLSLFLRRLPLFLFLLLLGTAAGATLALVLPPRYVAEATLIVESEQIPGELAASTVRTAATEQLQIIQQRILTREKLLEMANRLKIHEPGPGQPPATLTADERVEDLRSRIEIVTTGGQMRKQQADATIVTVSFSASTSALSAAVTNEVVTMILDENVKMRTSVSGQTLDFFTREVERLDQELAKRGAEILAFRQQHNEALPDSLEFRREQQVSLQERLRLLESEEAAVKGLRERFLARHDSSARERRAGGQVPATEAAAQPGPDRTTAFDVELGKYDGQIAELAAQKAELASAMEALRKSIEETPGNTVQLDTLERDYENLRQQYDRAVANRAQAEIGDTIEALSKGQRITVVEQAVAPAEPNSPNRKMIVAAGVAGGLAAGGGLILLLEMLNTSLRRPADLAATLGIATFATLPYMRGPDEIMRRRLLIGLAMGLVLVALPAGLWAVHTYMVPLDLLLNQILRKIGIATFRIGAL
ncbi:lipopolysaccharide biosynthesis protein [Cereibacter sphaeroides]|uniref:Wzz/FepE/Etk N-terminal domain-containing protein n=1 Tax=Cereibacter sphaeroides TaxID=1063 RepID=UPI001F180BDF|nr:Wzz/FepE/Etk N-terminal domain-containing protein [Cereibacter sphaeroides]MCE6950283.1 lipopolysaccharide biosynthesis protein [Cereibacter sphaeroides]